MKLEIFSSCFILCLVPVTSIPGRHIARIVSESGNGILPSGEDQVDSELEITTSDSGVIRVDGGATHKDGAAVDMQCFGCNGELMFDFLDPQKNTHWTDGLPDIFSMTPGKFELVASTSKFLSKWVSSHCLNTTESCQKCNHVMWFLNRPDGVCRRLYIYYVAMSADDITMNFDGMNTMSHYMICFLKHHFGFDVLGEWYPPLAVFDGRLTSDLYVARILVYDVHHASLLDGINQIHQMSLMTYMLRHRLKRVALAANETRSQAYSLVETFDLGNRMRNHLNDHHVTAQTNHSSCICKVVLGALLKFKYMEHIDKNCSLGCFTESFKTDGIKLEQFSGDPCSRRSNSRGFYNRTTHLLQISIINILLYLSNNVNK